MNHKEKRQLAHDLKGPAICANCELLEQCHAEWLSVKATREKYTKSGKLMPKDIRRTNHIFELCHKTNEES